MAKELVANASIDLEALRDGHAQARQHNRDEAAGAGAVHVIEVVAWQQLVLVKAPAAAAGYRPLFVLQSSLALGDLMHEALHNEQAGVAANASTVCSRFGQRFLNPVAANTADVPSVRIRSSQQLCFPTAVLHASPVLSAMVADVPVVRMLSGRDGESWGGWSDILEAVGALYAAVWSLAREGESEDRALRRIAASSCLFAEGLLALHKAHAASCPAARSKHA